MTDDRLYLVHIGECIGQVERYTAPDITNSNTFA